MNLGELRHLSDWIDENIPPLIVTLQKIQAALQHNSRQAAKQPLSVHFEEAKELLEGMPNEALNREERRLLSAFGAGGFVGKEGLEFLTGIESKTDFDPVTELKRVVEAVTSLQNTITKKSLRGAQGLGSAPEEPSMPSRQRRLGSQPLQLFVITAPVGAVLLVDLFCPDT